MTAKRLTTAFSMTLREFARRRAMILIMVAMPLLTFLVVGYTLPDVRASIDAIEHGVHVRVETSQASSFAGVTAIIYVGMLAGITGFYVMSSAMRTDQRLILAGFAPVELVTARYLMLLVVSAAITAEQFGLMLFFFTPLQMMPYLLSLYWGAVIYALCGAFTATLIRNELGGVLTVFFVSNMDLGTFQIPGFTNVADQWWVKALPGYFPVQLAVDAAFTSVADRLWVSFFVVPYAILVGGVTLLLYRRATHVHNSFMPERAGRSIPSWVAYVGIAVVAAAAAAGVASYRSQPAVLVAEGRIDARGQQLLAPTSGLVRVLSVSEGDDVERGQTVGWVADSLTNELIPMRASLSGRVTKVDVQPGQYVVVGGPLASVWELDALDAVLEVEETDLPTLAIGQAVEVTFAALGATTTSYIESIVPIPLPPDSSASQQTRQIRKYQVKCPVAQPDERLKVGMAVKARVYLDSVAR